MTISANLQASQGGAGLPITILGGFQSTNPSDFRNNNFAGIGVTTTSALPATFAALAHASGLDAVPLSSAFFDSANETYLQARQAGVAQSYADQWVFKMLQRLDGNFVAGRYLWMLVFDTAAPPATTDPPVAHAGPYLIR